jgi:hypothetical protein
MAARIPRWIARAAVAAPVFLLLAAGDLALRSRSALLEAEKQQSWRDSPAAKTAYFEAEFRRESEAAQKEAVSENLPQESAARRIALLEAEKEFRISESSAKMAYIWYRTAAEDFDFPLNPWAAQARKELPAALAAWRAELATKGIKAEPWMLQ